MHKGVAQKRERIVGPTLVNLTGQRNLVRNTVAVGIHRRHLAEIVIKLLRGFGQASIQQQVHPILVQPHPGLVGQMEALIHRAVAVDMPVRHHQVAYMLGPADLGELIPVFAVFQIGVQGQHKSLHAI